MRYRTLQSLGTLALLLLLPLQGHPQDQSDTDSHRPSPKPTAPGRTDLEGNPLPPGAVARLGSISFYHSSNAIALCFGPDGKSLASSDRDLVRIWEVPGGRMLLEIAGGKGGETGGEATPWNVTGLTFSPDGKTLATIGEQESVRLWDTSSGKEVGNLAAVAEIATNARFSPEGSLIAVTTPSESSVLLADPSTGQVTRRLDSPGEHKAGWGGGGLAFSPDGRFLAAGGSGRVIGVWKWPAGDPIGPLEGHKGAVTALAFSSDGETLVSGGEDSGVHLWDVARGELKLRGKGVRDRIVSVAISPDGRLYGARERTAIFIWETKTGRQVHKFSFIMGKSGTVAFSPDGKLFATEGGRRVYLWDPENWKERIGGGRTASITSVAFWPDGKKLATAGHGPNIRLWETATGKALGEFDRRWGRDSFVEVLRDGSRVAFGSSESPLQVWDLDKEETLLSVSWQQGLGKFLAMAPDEKTLAFGGRARGVIIWDLEEGRETHLLMGHRRPPSTGAFSPDGKTLVTASFQNQDLERTVIAWDMTTGQERFHLDGGLRPGSMTIAPDGKTFAWMCNAGQARVASLETGKEIRRLQVRPPDSLHPVSAEALSFSPDGKLLVAGDPLGRLALWEASTGDEVGRVGGVEGGIRALRFSPDGRRLATITDAGTAVIWDMKEVLGLASRSPKVEKTGKPGPEQEGQVPGTPGRTARGGARHVHTVPTRRFRSARSGLPHLALALLGSPELKHTDDVLGVAFSPDGESVASVSKDGTVIIWDRRSGREIRRAGPLGRPVHTVAYTPDGMRLITGDDRGARLWNLDSGWEEHWFQGWGPWLSTLSVAPDGATLAFGTLRGVVEIWATDTRKLLRKTRVHGGGVSAVAFSGDGEVLAAAGKTDGAIRLWDAATAELLGTLEGHIQEVKGLAFSPDGKLLVSGGLDSAIHLWDVHKREFIRKFLPGAGVVRSVVFSPDGRVLIASCLRGVRVWDTSNWARRNDWGELPGGAGSLVFSPDGGTIAAGTLGNQVLLWDVAAKKRLHEPSGGGAHVKNVVVSPDGRIVATATGKEYIRLWEMDSGRPLRDIGAGPGDAYSLIFSPDSSALASTGHSGAIRVWDVQTGETVAEFKGLTRQSAHVRLFAFSGDGKSLALGSVGGGLRIWDVLSGDPFDRLPGPGIGIVPSAVSPDGTTLAWKDGDKVGFWDLRSRRGSPGVESTRCEYVPITFSPDGMTVATPGMGGRWGFYDSAVFLYDSALQKPYRKLEGPSNWIRAVAFSPDGRILVAGDKGGGVWVWSVPTGRLMKMLPGHRGPVETIAFAPGGNRVVSGSADGTAIIWDLSTAGRHAVPLKATLTRQDEERLWEDLGSGEAEKAYQATWTLVGVGRRIVPFLGDRLGGVQEPSQEVKELIQDLFSDDPPVRQSAQEGLRRLGEEAEPALRKALEDGPSPEVRARLAAILEGLRFASQKGATSSLQALRAIQVLEQVPTEESTEILESIRNESGTSRVREAAALALERMVGATQRKAAPASGETTAALFRRRSGQGPHAVTAEEIARREREAARRRPHVKDPSVPTDRFGDALPAGAVARMRTLTFGLTRRAKTLAISSDGKTIVAGHLGGYLRIRDAETGKTVTLQAHELVVQALAISTDGKTVATGGRDPTIRLWDVPSGARRAEIRGHNYGIFALAFSPDGERLASSSRDGTVRVWDVPTGKQLWWKKAYEVKLLTWSPDGGILATVSRKAVVHWWDGATGKETASLEGHKDGIQRIRFAGDGGFFFSASGDQVVKVWEVPSGREVRSHDLKEAGCRLQAFLGDGTALLGRSGETPLFVWDLDTAEEVRNLSIDKNARLSLLTSNGRTLLWQRGRDSALLLWDAVEDRKIRELPRPPPHVPSSLAFSPDGSTLATAGRDSTARLWEVTSGKDLAVIEWDGKEGRAVAYSPDGRFLATGGVGELVRVWDPHSLEQVRELRCDEHPVTCVAFSDDGKALAVGSWNSAIRLWDTETWQETAKLQKRLETYHSIAFSPDGKTLASGGGVSVRVWDLAKAEEILYIDAEAAARTTTIAYGPDGRTLIGASPRGVWAWDAVTGENLGSILSSTGRGRGNFAISPDRRWIASGGNRTSVRIWEVATGKQVLSIGPETGSTAALAFSAGGEWLATSWGTDSYIWALSPPGGLPDGRGQVAPEDYPALWDALAGEDAPGAYLAIHKLSTGGPLVAGWIGSNLAARTSPKEEAILRRITDLGDDEMAVREAASEDLRRMGGIAQPGLRQSLEKTTDPEVKMRISAILRSARSPIVGEGGDEVRALRSVLVLERIGSGESSKVLNKIAEESPSPRVRTQARVSLGRLDRREDSESAE